MNHLRYLENFIITFNSRDAWPNNFPIRRQGKRLIRPTHLFRCHRWEACPILIQMVQFQIQGSQIQIQFLLVASAAFRSLLRSPCRWACGRRHIQSGCIRLLAFLNLLASLILILQAFQSLSLLQYLQ